MPSIYPRPIHFLASAVIIFHNHSKFRSFWQFNQINSCLPTSPAPAKATVLRFGLFTICWNRPYLESLHCIARLVCRWWMHCKVNKWNQVGSPKGILSVRTDDSATRIGGHIVIQIDGLGPNDRPSPNVVLKCVFRWNENILVML